MVENVYASIVKELSQTGALAYALIPDEALQACDMFSEETLRSLVFFQVPERRGRCFDRGERIAGILLDT
jgi:hypothetical protein